jgi:hypothetical protein
MQDQTISVSFTIKELERMLSNAKAGGSVEVVITISSKLVIR